MRGTRTTWLAATTLVAVAAIGVARADHHEGEKEKEKRKELKAAAVVQLEPRSESGVSGWATFTSDGGRVVMKVEVEGLTPGPHAIHLHETGDCSDPQGKSAGGHWNPTHEDHGEWGAAPFHHGDIGNLEADTDGRATLTFESDVWTIGGGGAGDIVGRAVIVHEKADDFTTQPTGAAGGRVACGVVHRK